MLNIERSTMIDHYDRKILELLQSNAKLTIKEISSMIQLSVTPVFERIKKLEKEGYIRGYYARLNREKLGFNLMVICNVTLDTHQSQYIEKFESDVLHLEEVKACYHIAGTYDYLLMIVVKDVTEYQYFVSKKLASLEHIGKVQSSFVMKEIKAFEF